MGEENKNGGEETIKQEEKIGGDELVLKVDMHCQGCARKVIRALTTFQGVEAIAVNSCMNTIVVKDNTIDSAKLCEIIRKKSGRNVQLVSPLPKADQPLPQPQLPITQDDASNKDQLPPVETVVLRVQMHCEACAQILRKRIRKIKGVKSVETDVGKDQVRVNGVIENPAALVEFVYKKTRKHADIIAVNDGDEKKVQKAGDGNDGKSEEVKKENEKEDNEMTINHIISRYHDYNYWVPSTRPVSNNYMDYNSFNYQQQPYVFSDEIPNACSIM